MINFVDRFSTIKGDLPICTLIVILSLEHGVEIRTLQYENESSNIIQYKCPEKKAYIESSMCPKSPLASNRKV